MTPVLIVPYHRGGRLRAANAAFVRRRLRALHPDWPLVMATSDPWSKAHAVNIAAKATKGAPLVICDADVLVRPEALVAAVEAVEAGSPWAVPHGTVFRLNPDESRTVRRGDARVRPRPLTADRCARKPYPGLPGGGLFVVSREAWETVGGFDERFDGWGSEDVSLGYALDTLAGPHWRGGAPLWHLSHPAAERTDRLDGHQALEARYLRARGNVDAMAELVAEHKGA